MIEYETITSRNYMDGLARFSLPSGDLYNVVIILVIPVNKL